MVYFGTIGQLYKTTSFLVVSTSFHSEMKKSVGNDEETTSLFFLHYDYQTKTCNQGNHSVVKTTNLFLQSTAAKLVNRVHCLKPFMFCCSHSSSVVLVNYNFN